MLRLWARLDDRLGGLLTVARIRTIKPEFWTDERVVELDFADRLLFIGLWNFADDQGFLAYRPKRIKMQVFPGDDYDVVAGLRRLWESSVLTLYRGPEGVLLHVTNWSRHQKVSNPSREKYSPSDLQELSTWEDAVQSPLESYPAEGKGREGKGKGNVSEVADATPDPPRDDVERICDHLADRIEANGSKRPTISKGWRDAARLMLDRDERTEEQVHAAIDWCQDDEFWRGNVLSLPKLRDKYDQLRLQAQRAGNVHQLRPAAGPDGEPILPPLPADDRR